MVVIMLNVFSGLQRADSVHHNNQMRSLDLETHDIELRCDLFLRFIRISGYI